jgi:hypothetical protein
LGPVPPPTVSAIASVTPVLTGHSWIPPTLGALAVTFQTGIGYLEAHVVSSGARHRDGGVRSRHDPTVELERESVWFRLPDDA